MQPIEFADILSTELQLAHTGYLSRYIRQNLGVSASEIRGGEK